MCNDISTYARLRVIAVVYNIYTQNGTRGSVISRPDPEGTTPVLYNIYI